MATHKEETEHLDILSKDAKGVNKWITKSLGLPYGPAFEEHHIDGNALKQLDKKVDTCMRTCHACIHTYMLSSAAPRS